MLSIWDAVNILFVLNFTLDWVESDFKATKNEEKAEPLTKCPILPAQSPEYPEGSTTEPHRSWQQEGSTKKEVSSDGQLQPQQALWLSVGCEGVIETHKLPKALLTMIPFIKIFIFYKRKNRVWLLNYYSKEQHMSRKQATGTRNRSSKVCGGLNRAG